jgi:hypothetical protein
MVPCVFSLGLFFISSTVSAISSNFFLILLSIADLYVVEFQKRGLPHTHTLIWLKRNTKEPSSALIDSFVCAELPDPEKDPLGYVLLDEFMVHGPCGSLNVNCPCMKEGICSKRFPKAYNDETLVDDKGFPVYRRRDDGRFVLRNKGTVKLTNKWVVPYNLGLLKRFQAHINVEWCNKTNLLKYLFKYVTKGPDVARVRFQAAAVAALANGSALPLGRNEIEEYIKCKLFIYPLFLLLFSLSCFLVPSIFVYYNTCIHYVLLFCFF